MTAWVPSGQGIELSTYVRGKLSHRNLNVTVVVDGEARRVPMGVQVLPIAGGRHEICVYMGLQLRSRRPSIIVDVPDGGVVRLRWDLPRFIWQPGRLELLP